MAEHFTNVAEITMFLVICNMGDNALSIKLHDRLEIRQICRVFGILSCYFHINKTHQPNIELYVRYISIFHGKKLPLMVSRTRIYSKLCTRVDEYEDR